MTEFGRKCDLQNGRKRCLLSSSGNDHLNGLFWAESVVAQDARDHHGRVDRMKDVVANEVCVFAIVELEIRVDEKTDHRPSFSPSSVTMMSPLPPYFQSSSPSPASLL